jgi:hypothetical protein
VSRQMSGETRIGRTYGGPRVQSVLLIPGGLEDQVQCNHFWTRGDTHGGRLIVHVGTGTIPLWKGNDSTSEVDQLGRVWTQDEAYKG